MSNASLAVTVIIPSYNRGHVIGRALHSVLDQTYQNFEVIVVDDASTDNTETILKSFGDPRVRYIRHDTRQGAAAARNTGIRAASSEFIAFQDSDDVWLPEKLGKQMKLFENASPQLGVVYTDMWRVVGDKKKYWSSPVITPEDGIVYAEALDRVMGIGIQTTVIKRECFHKAGMFDERLPRLIDFELFIRLSQHYYFCHIGLPLVSYCDMGGCITANDEALVAAYALIMEKHSCGILRNKKSAAKKFFFIGNTLCKNGKLGPGRCHILKAIRLQPLNVVYFIALLISFFGKHTYRAAIRLKTVFFP